MFLQDLSLDSLLHLEDLLRLILLLPQSAKIQEFTQKKISLRKFSTPECLLGLVTAEDLGLTTTADDLFQFINNNLGIVALKKDRADSGRIVSGADTASPIEMYELISKHIKAQDEETQKKILRSLDTSSFTKEEILNLVKNSIEDVQKHFNCREMSLRLYKDEILTGKGKGLLFFFPQHVSKME